MDNRNPCDEMENSRRGAVLLQRTNRGRKAKIYSATVHGAQHVINNLLNQLQYFTIEARKHSDFDPKKLMLLDEVLENASSLMKALSEVQQLDEEVIKQSVYPKPELNRSQASTPQNQQASC